MYEKNLNRDPGLFTGSLNGKFILLTLLIFILISTISFLAYEVVVDNATEELGKILARKQVAFDKSRSLQPLLREVDLASHLVQSPAVREWAKNENDPDLKRRAIDELESYREMFRDKSYFFVIDKSGNYYYNDKDGRYTKNEYRYTLSPDNPKDGWYYLTAASGPECKLNVDQDRKLKVTKVWINCPVTEDGKTLGIIGTGINLFNFIQQIVDIKQPGVNNIFVDESGAIQAHRNLQYIDFRSLTKSINERKTVFQMLDSPDEQKEFRALLDSLTGEDKGVGTMFVNIDGNRYLAGVAYLEKMRWYNITLMDLRVLIGPGRFTYFAGLMAGVLVLTLLIVTTLLKYFILDRLYRLERSVRLVTKGKYTPRERDIDPKNDEIGRLSESFHEMARTIGEYTNNLEHVVEERTRNLWTEINERKKAEEEMKKAKEKAEEATRLKDKFVTLVAHDLRSPFATIIGLLSVLKDDNKKVLDPEHAGIINRATGIGEGMIRMIDELLKISRLQLGKITPIFEFIDSFMAVQHCIANYIHIAQNKEIVIHNEVPPGTRIYADSNMFVEVIQNLLSNAIKFSNKGGEITFFVPSGKKSTIAIRDNGVGIGQKNLPTIFSYEVKTNTVGTAGETGSGFGLPFSRELIEAHGGSLTVESVKGKGSVFFVELPYMKPKILLANADRNERINLCRLLEKIESDFSEAENGKDALEIMQKDLHNLVIADIDMPIKGGFELLAGIRSSSGSASVPVILLSSDADINIRDKAFEMGANDFISKPVELEDLLSRVKKILNHAG
ncbi:MAG: response regulator [Nitrospinota bacterium]|nr:response regulator [Nitrospinota bacterium]